MFSPYRKLFAVPGALRFSVSGGSIARLPISMTLLSITFVIVHVKHSYTLGWNGGDRGCASSPQFSALPGPDMQIALGQRKVLRFTIPFYIAFRPHFPHRNQQDTPRHIYG
jgi:hypothetical protein